MLTSAGMRFLIVGLLALTMLIPLQLVSEVVEERADYSRSTLTDVSREWGGAQLLSGPQLVVPVQETVTYNRRREVIDPETGQARRDAKDEIIYEHYSEEVTETRRSVYLYPNGFDLNVTTETQQRRRGIFQVPVYQANAEMVFDLPVAEAASALRGKEVLLWDQAELRVFLSSNRALRGPAVLSAGNADLSLEPLPAAKGATNGIFAKTGDPRDLPEEFRLSIGLNGAQSLQGTAVGRTSRITITSDWPHPSFFGTFLPDGHEISETGFTAHWTVPHLARTLPQISREDVDPSARRNAAMGVRFFQPNDFYQKAYRSARYGILFIGLTFLTVLLMDRTSARPAHPVQYILIGLAQAVFVLLMLAYSEQIGFGPAYLLAAGATAALLVMFGAVALGMARRVWALGGLLVVLYAVLYLILRSEDYALLAGATLAFAALAGTMYLTRNEDWYGPERAPAQTGRGWLRRAAPQPEAAGPKPVEDNPKDDTQRSP